MVMRIIVDAVAPGPRPSVRFEQPLEDCRRIGTRQMDRIAVINERKPRIVGNRTIVAEPGGVGLAPADKAAHRRGRPRSDVGHLLNAFLERFESQHRKLRTLFATSCICANAKCGTSAKVPERVPRKTATCRPASGPEVAKPRNF